jgi:hypothetical protein
LHPSLPPFNLKLGHTSTQIDTSLNLSQTRATPLHSQTEPRKLLESELSQRRRSTLGCRPRRSLLPSLAPLRVRTFPTKVKFTGLTQNSQVDPEV